MPAPRPPAAPAPPGSDPRVALAVILFAGSGCSALIYEIVWFQLLELVVGSSAISLGILLGTFMGGLCLGSLLLPRLMPERLHPFRVYSWLELGIGVLAILVLLVTPLAGRLYTGSGAHGPWGVVLRAAIAGLCLLPPTVLMGATLPAIARWVGATPAGVGRLGMLYAANIAGGIVGCLVAGFWLLRVLDVTGATAVAVTLNLVVALVAWGLSGPWVAPAATPAAETALAPRIPPALIHVAIALSGLTALGGQVVWTRNLALLLGGTVYTFSIILAVYLVGLGIGSGMGAARARTSDRPDRDLGLCQLLLVAAIAWSAFMVHRSLPFWPVAPSLARNPWMSFQLDMVRCLWAILPPTLLWGASFPLALAAAAARGRDAARTVAGIYAANTVGAIAGALGFSLVMMPAFGTQAAQQWMIALSVAAALLVLAPGAWPPWAGGARAAQAALVAVAIAIAAWLGTQVPAVPGTLVALGRYVAFRQETPATAAKGSYDDPNLLYVGEGLTESVAVSDNGRVRLFHVSGKVEATTEPKDMRLQRMLPNLPALVHPAPRSVLIVGFGAGVTAGAFVVHPSVQRIVICEIEPLVIRRISQYFRKENYDILADPRVEVVYDDARHYILTTRERFDVITSDPIHPWVKGSGALYSRDYFELVKRHLNPGGVVSQWVPLYQSSEATVKGELATFFDVFPNGSVWANLDRGRGYDVVLLGMETPAPIDLDALEARLARPDHRAVVQSLAEVGFPTGIDLLATYAGRHADLGPWLAGAEINRDRRPWLQYRAGLESYVTQKDDTYGSMHSYRRFPDDLFVGSEALRDRLRAGGTGEAGAP